MHDLGSYDLAVIGSGPAGEGAALKGAKSCKRVLMIERHPEVGGACTHWATIPSKSLRHSVQTLLGFRQSPLFAGQMLPTVSFPRLLQTAESVIQRQVSMRRTFYQRNHVEVVHGQASFVSPTELEIAHGEQRTRVHAAKVVIATGSRPYHPTDIDFSHAQVRDSDSILSLTTTPDTLTVYGAGVVGCEYASIFASLGVKVNLINSRNRLLSFLDDEITDALSFHLRDQGVVIRHSEEYTRLETMADNVMLHLKSGKKIGSEVILWAQGRTGNTQALGLERVGLETDARGQLQVDGSLRTGQPHIYAAGDVIGYPSLASASYDQGRFAAEHALFGRAEFALTQDIPTGIYTSPEISSLGRTERELTAAGVPYEVGYSQFRNLARAQIVGAPVGMLKLLFHRDSLQILGIHCFGEQAAEIVHIGQAIMRQKGEANSLMYFANTTFNYPTMAEAYRVAALNGLNRLAPCAGPPGE